MKFEKNIKIVVADDHPMLLNGLKYELELHQYEVVGKAKNGEEALDEILTKKPDIAMLDINMPILNGFEVIQKAKEKKSQTKFIILSFYKEPEYILKAKELHINGYLLKEDQFEEIEKCIETVLSDKYYYSNSIQKLPSDSPNDDLEKLSQLTSSEKTILKLIADQKSNAEISDILSISKRTVEKHRSNIIYKMDLNGGTNSLTNWVLLNKQYILSL
ncbi:response regulator transcription factor [Flavicella sp.]|uniref:response regulator transcription factor n=1 Tax=Flavicella sp. TaxID=2957742 RepID=UPI00261B2D8E|nr:response regulator transcription factor [Flavicella sp.]MDG1805441.1 response regulator transcription factor [Flavicella sp.]